VLFSLITWLQGRAGQGRLLFIAAVDWVVEAPGPARSLLACLPDYAVLYGLYYLHGPFVDSRERTPNRTWLAGSRRYWAIFLEHIYYWDGCERGKMINLLFYNKMSAVKWTFSYLYGVSHS
jgi:hypothetical protein